MERRRAPATAPERLQKVLADRGVASRRSAEELIRTGRVSVEGRTVTVLGTKVDPASRIEVDGRAVRPPRRHRYLMLHKPAGVLSTARDERGRATVVDLVGARERLYPVGRLDADSEGLLLLTDDGEWAQRLLHPRYGHEREYEVTVAGSAGEDALAALCRGVRLEEGVARAVVASAAPGRGDGTVLRLVVRTGWKRQVRRMCAAVGLRVVRLRRVRLGPLRLGALQAGRWRELTRREVASLGVTAGSTR